MAPPEDSILWRGPSRRIESYDVASPGGIESYGVAPPAGSTLLGLERDRDMGRDRDWDRDRDRDRTFCCDPSQGIGLSAVAPPAGSDFPLWPLPGDWTFRCGPSQGIGLSDVAPPAESNPTVWPSPQDRLPHWGIV